MFCNTYITCNQLLLCIELGPKSHGNFMHLDLVPTRHPEKLEQKSPYAKLFISCEIILKSKPISAFVEITTHCFVAMSSILLQIISGPFALYPGAIYPTLAAKGPFSANRAAERIPLKYMGFDRLTTTQIKHLLCCVVCQTIVGYYCINITFVYE